MKKAESFWESFGYAREGLKHCIRSERNFRIHMVMGVIAFTLGVVLQLTRAELAILLLLIGLVLIAEMLNTALENLVDLCTEDYHPLAKVVKDVAAGAVLLLCIVAVLIGIIIFVPHIFDLLIQHGLLVF
ncbi:MAG: diacylglycerol kinase family protein [Firmicutes bacterium]|nr:diacylglycerol kinase family protein [Bacillota bacterium]